MQIRKAVSKDSKFIAAAIRDAERAHTGVGIWDIVGGSDVDIVPVLEHACLNDTASHFHISRFFVAKDDDEENPAAVACGFIYPECSLTKSKPGVCASLVQIYNWSESEVSQAWDRLNFLDDCFPDFEYNDSWMVEAVFTDPAHRGKGLGAEVINAVLAEGRKTGCKKALITCAVGNQPAKRLYERLGFKEVGQGSSDIAMEKLGSPGFYLLCLYF